MLSNMMYNLFGNYDPKRRVLIYTLGYIFLFLLTIVGFLAIMLIVQHLTLDPMIIFSMAFIAFLLYAMIQLAITHARMRVQDEVEREKRIEKIMTNDN